MFIAPSEIKFNCPIGTCPIGNFHALCTIGFGELFPGVLGYMVIQYFKDSVIVEYPEFF